MTIRPFAGAVCACAAVLALTTGAPAQKSPKAHLAPADMYFGRMKISFIGINNTFAHTARDVHDYTTDSGIANKIDFAMDALNDWRGKYPRDPQLARSYFLGQIALKKIWIKKYQDKAWSYMQVIRTTYAGTYFAKTVDADLARGFTEHYFADPAACDPAVPPTPLPSPAAADNGKYNVLVHPAACVTPSPSPSPSPMPTPEPAGTSAPASAVPQGAPATPNAPSPAGPSPVPNASVSP